MLCCCHCCLLRDVYSSSFPFFVFFYLPLSFRLAHNGNISRADPAKTFNVHIKILCVCNEHISLIIRAHINNAAGIISHKSEKRKVEKNKKKWRGKEEKKNLWKKQKEKNLFLSPPVLCGSKFVIPYVYLSVCVCVWLKCAHL